MPFLSTYRKSRAAAVAEFYVYVADLLEHEDVRRLDEYSQHLACSRLRHSMDVAYYSYRIARFLRWDCRSTARGGLLHDLYLYDWRDDSFDGNARDHALGHARTALQNARRITELNAIEENIILRHMWLLNLIPPRYKEGFIVTFVDKFCAAKEFAAGFFASGREVRHADLASTLYY